MSWLGRRRPGRVVAGRYLGNTTPAGRSEPAATRDVPAGVAAAADLVATWQRPILSPAELEVMALADDHARRGALAELMLGMPDRAERRELLVWGIRMFVDAPTAPTTATERS